jgi:hypothetical protein
LTKKCESCGLYPVADIPAVVRIEAQDGVLELEVCDKCCEFFTKSAEVFTKKKERSIYEEFYDDEETGDVY